MLELFQRLLASYGYLVVALVVMAEGTGIPLPGETILLLGAAYAGAGHLSVRGVILAAALGAITGDNLGYYLGWRGGRALLVRYGHLFRLNDRHLARAESFYARHGAKTVFFARFVAVLRTLSSLLAGANRMPYRRFVVWNAAGGILWAVVIGTLGSIFGSEWRRLAHWIGRASLLLVLGLALFVIGSALRRGIVASGGLAPFLRARLANDDYLGRPLTTGVLLLLLAGAVFATIAAKVAYHAPLPWLDRDLLADFPPVAPGVFDGLMRAATFVGRPATLLAVSALLALLFARRRRWSDLLLVALAVGGGEALNVLLKLLFARPRPGLADLLTYSFPSGHSTGSMAFFGLLVYLAFRAGDPGWRRTLALLGGTLAIFLIGISRVYLGEHYPTDVLGGWAIGLVWLAIVVTAVETWRRRRAYRLEHDILPDEEHPRGRHVAATGRVPGDPHDHVDAVAPIGERPPADDPRPG